MKALASPALLILLTVSSCATMQTAMQTSTLIMEGRYDQAEALLEAQLTDPENSSMMAFEQLCSIYTFTKDYGKLFNCLDRFDARVRQGEGATYMVHSAPRMRAMALLDTGQYDQAISEANKCFGKASALRSKMHFGAPMTWFALFECLSVKGISYVMAGDYPRAEATIQELMDIGSAGMQEEYRSLMIARIYLGMSEYQKGLAVLRRRVEEHSIFTDGAVKPAYALFQEEIAKPGPLQGTMLSPIVMKIPQIYTVSKLLLETGDRELAKRGFDKIVDLPQLSQVGFIAWYAFADRARIAEMEGDYQVAVDFYRRAIQIIEEQRATVGSDAGRIGFVADKQSVYRGMISSLVALARVPEAFEFVERAKARALVDMLAARAQFAAPMGSARQLNDLLARLHAAENRASLAKDPIEISTSRGVVMNVRNEIRRVDPRLASLVTVEGSDANSIARGLGSDETLIEYYYQDRRLYAFTLTQAGVSGIELESRGLEDNLRSFRAALQDPLSDEYELLGERLYRILLAPLEPRITTQNLVIVPHGILHYIPFAALYSGNAYLIDRYTVSVLPSASVREFLRPHTGAERTGSLLILGNPDLGNPAYDLRFAEAEARTIAQLIPGSTLLLRDQASETNFKQIGGSFSALHFATHGRFDAETPLTSGLLLHGDSREDGMLTVEELYGLQLGADLVILSACETALGEIANGDDVVGLTRGFLFAGANAIVSTLWQVDDRATAALMRMFYTAMRGSDTRTALHQAQLAVKDGGFEHPFYWAAFQLSGRPD